MEARRYSRRGAATGRPQVLSGQLGVKRTRSGRRRRHCPILVYGTNAIGRRCRHRSHTTQNHGVPRRSCSRVGTGARSMPSRMTKFAPAEQPREVDRFGLATTYILWRRIGHLIWSSPAGASHAVGLNHLTSGDAVLTGDALSLFHFSLARRIMAPGSRSLLRLPSLDVASTLRLGLG
jgi:hypothetical protein